MNPLVQISLDLTSINETLETAEMALRAGDDWLEAGTPLILAEGLHGVRALRERFPKTPIVADLKTMDGGCLEDSLRMNSLRMNSLRMNSLRMNCEQVHAQTMTTSGDSKS